MELLEPTLFLLETMMEKAGEGGIEKCNDGTKLQPSWAEAATRTDESCIRFVGRCQEREQKELHPVHDGAPPGEEQHCHR